MKNLTLKQKLFIKEYVKSKNATQSASKVYNVKNRNVAKNIGSENLSNPNIKNRLERLLREVEYSPKLSISNLMDIEATKVYKTTAGDKIRASELLLKLSGLLTENKHSINLNYDIDNLDNGSLIKIKEKYTKLANRG